MFMADDPTTGIEELGALDVAELYDEGKAMLIDVRTPMEYAYEHVRGALADLRQDAPPMSPELAAATVLSPDGEAVSLATLVAEQPTVVLFLRHFG